MNKSTEPTSQETDILSFDPIVPLLDVAKKWLLIIVITVVATVGTYIASDLSYKPIYQTTTTFVVTARGSSSTVFSNLTSTSSVASVFSELLNSSLMRQAILQDLDVPAFDGTISASAVSETNLLNVKVTASDPRTAFLVSRAIIDHHEELTYRVVDNVTMEVLMRPTVPIAPINQSSAASNAKKTVLLAAAAATVLFAALSISQDKIRSGREARNKLDCSYLGKVDHEIKYRTLSSWLRKKKSSILITNPITSFRFVETIRKLRHRIEQRMRGDKVLMVTSLLENEGKSTIAVNLALSMAQKKSKVLLIDCDLRKPACFHLLERRTFPHTTVDVVTGQVPPEQAIIQDKKTGLYLMLENRRHASSGDMIASEGMEELITWAREHFDFVVLDLPPMGEVSDAETMSKFADASVLVVRQNIAPAPAVNKAVQVLDKSHAKLLGCILNNVYSSFLSSGQGYGGYTSYGKYGHYGHYHSKATPKR